MEYRSEIQFLCVFTGIFRGIPLPPHVPAEGYRKPAYPFPSVLLFLRTFLSTHLSVSRFVPSPLVSTLEFGCPKLRLIFCTFRFDYIRCRKATTKPQGVKGAFIRMLTVLVIWIMLQGILLLRKSFKGCNAGALRFQYWVLLNCHCPLPKAFLLVLLSDFCALM